MSYLDWLFYMCAIGTVGCSIGALLVPNVVYGVLFLIGAFFNASGLFLLLGAEFLAFVLIVVYVGAVALLFLFIIMSVEVRTPKERMTPFYKKPSLFLGIVLGVEILAFLTGKFHMGTLAFPTLHLTTSNTHAIGKVLYTKYFFHFQMVGMILLTAMIGAIVLIWQKDRGVRRQKMREQSAVTASDRLSMKQVPLGKGVSS